MRHPAFRVAKPYYPPNPVRKTCACADHCGRTFSANRGSDFHPDCRNDRLCRCGCGLRFPLTGGRRFHPQCETRRARLDRPDRDKSLMLYGPRQEKRCKECEDMGWRRPKRRDCACGLRFEPEVIERDGSSTGCGIAQIL